jgi:Leucine-rich repeat (LRR) protein
MEHKAHILEIFDEHFRDLDGIVANILNIFKKNNDINMINLKRLMNAIINDYSYCPNYSHFFIIRQCYFFLNNPKSSTNIIAPIKYDYIKTLKDLINFKGDLKNIKKIIFPRQNIKDLNDIKFGELINLTELDLSHNDITCIEPLSKYKLPNLKALNLTVNLIDDSNKEYFFKFDFPELTDLNLFENKLTDYEIFGMNNKKNMPKLKLVFIGGNIFEFPKTLKSKEELKFDFSTVNEMGFSKSVFNQKSIMFLPCFDFQNLTIIYLQGNNLNSLDFVEDLELPSIKEIWLSNNQLTEFEPLKKYKTLEKIEMKNNKISDIEEIDTFIKHLPTIKSINFIGNCIKFDFLVRNILELQMNDGITILVNPQ